jgi:hypothetical protein
VAASTVRRSRVVAAPAGLWTGLVAAPTVRRSRVVAASAVTLWTDALYANALWTLSKVCKVHMY